MLDVISMQAQDLVKQNQFDLLLVEDDDVDVMNVKRALRKNNLNLPVRRAVNGVEALELLRQYYDSQEPGRARKLLILLDLNMPKMGGLEFLQILRSEPKFCQIPVIVLTTSDQSEDIAAAYEFNVAGYIVKPVEFQKFVEMINVISRYWGMCKILG